MRVPGRKEARDAAISGLEPARIVRVRAAGLTAMVAPGDRVAAGQLIARSPEAAEFGRRRHSPYDGTVVTPARRGEIAIEGRPGEPAPAGGCRIVPPASRAIVEAAREAGIEGLGGGMFPTWAKLSPGRSIECVIVNGCESEPWLTCDARVLAEARQEVECGLRLAQLAVGAPRGVIVADDAGYPGGYERFLVRQVLGRDYPTGGRPRDAGALVLNVQTARALHLAVCRGRALLDRVVTVAGGAVGRPGNYVIALGTPLAHVLTACGTDLAATGAKIAGGAMMGSEADADSVVEPGTGGILALSRSEVRRPVDNPCIRCGDCLEACPVGLSARHLILRPSGALGRCMECGMCQYVCPADRSLVALLRHAKGYVR